MRGSRGESGGEGFSGSILLISSLIFLGLLLLCSAASSLRCCVQFPVWDPAIAIHCFLVKSSLGTRSCSCQAVLAEVSVSVSPFHENAVGTHKARVARGSLPMVTKMAVFEAIGWLRESEPTGGLRMT